MTAIRIECPSCGQRIETTPETAASGVDCPGCGTKFWPETVAHLDESPKAAPAQKHPVPEPARRAEPKPKPVEQSHEYGALKEAAHQLFFIGCWGLGISVVVGVAAVLNDAHSAWYIISGGVCSLSVAFLFFSQLLEIRAALEKRR